MGELKRMSLIDFTGCCKSIVNYSGSEKKLGIIYDESYISEKRK